MYSFEHLTCTMSAKKLITRAQFFSHTSTLLRICFYKIEGLKEVYGQKPKIIHVADYLIGAKLVLLSCKFLTYRYDSENI